MKRPPTKPGRISAFLALAWALASWSASPVFAQDRGTGRSLALPGQTAALARSGGLKLPVNPSSRDLKPGLPSLSQGAKGQAPWPAAPAAPTARPTAGPSVGGQTGRPSALAVLEAVAPIQGSPEARPAAAPRLDAAFDGRGAGVDTSVMDPSVRPQDDFYRYANGSWLKSYKIPADRSSSGAFYEVRDRSDSDVRKIIRGLLAGLHPGGGDEQRIADIYKSFANTKEIQARGLSPVAEGLARLDNIGSKAELAEVFAGALAMGVDSPVALTVDQDSKEPSSYIASIGQSGLGLPDRDYYFDDQFDQARRGYRAYVAALLRLSGEKDAASKANAVFELEKALAGFQWTNVEKRDQEKGYNKLPVEGLGALAPGFDWKGYLQAAKLPSGESSIIVSQPSYLTGFAKVISERSVGDWKLYMKVRTLDAAAPFLSRAFVRANFNYQGRALQGQTKMRPRAKRAVDLVNGTVGELVGRLYVKERFPESSKKRMEQLVENLRAAFAERIQGLDWMGSETKKQALEKLRKFTPKIGYPDGWRDYSGLQASPDDLIGNLRRARILDYERMMGKLGRPVDRGEWQMTPQTVNAYYNPLMNEIVFPAAILQAPFFSPDADDAVNYGGIGAVIGHEMSHGFDDQGAKSDGDGRLRDWWTKQDEEAFKARAGRLVTQYDAFKPLPDAHINGQLTLGENIADFSGMTVAYRAYRMALGAAEPAVIAGFTGDQRFFLGWSQVWRSRMREKTLRMRLQTDPHSPGEFRANGVVRNMPEFYQAFDVKQGDGLFLPESERAKIF